MKHYSLVYLQKPAGKDHGTQQDWSFLVSALNSVDSPAKEIGRIGESTWLIFDVGQRKIVKAVIRKAWTQLPRREVKVWAHFFTALSVVMCFSSVVAMFLMISAHDRKGGFGSGFVACVLWFLHVIVISKAIRLWRTEKKKLVVCIDPEGGGIT